MSGGRGSEKSVLATHHDDDNDGMSTIVGLIYTKVSLTITVSNYIDN